MAAADCVSDGVFAACVAENTACEAWIGILASVVEHLLEKTEQVIGPMLT